MKAIRIYERGTTDVMKLEEVPVPELRDDEVLIKVAAAGVNYADIGQRRGDYPNLASLPTILGSEVAGVVIGQGRDIERQLEGQRVVSLVDGGYAEYAIARANEVVLLPEQVSYAQATVIPVQGQTAYLALKKASRLRAGERVLVHAAAGGVGTLAIQLARLLGASLIIGTIANPDNVSLLHELGADLVVNTNNEQWIEQVMQATRGQGVDVILDSIGGEIGQKSIACLAPLGRLTVFGSVAGITPVVTQMLIPRCQSINGYNTLIQPLEDKMHASQALVEYIAQGQLQVVQEQSFPLEQANRAHQAIEERKTRGKVVLTL